MINLPLNPIQVWINVPSANFGLVLVSTSDDSTRFETSENGTGPDRPVLTVTFAP